MKLQSWVRCAQKVGSLVAPWVVISLFWASGVLAQTSPGDPGSIAVLGDSLATGAATHPALAFDAKVLWDVFQGQVSVAPRAVDLPAHGPWPVAEPLERPERLWPGPREYFGGLDWLFRNTLQAISRVYLDTEEYSWGYLVTAGLGLPPRRLLLAAENGARVEAIPRQVDRVLDATGGRLPARIFLLFTGNDLCGPTLAQATSAADYASQLMAGLLYLLRNGTPAEGGTDVYVLSHLGITQLLYEPSIQAKKILAHGEETSCSDLRARGYLPKDPGTYQPNLPPEARWFGMVMPPSPATYCPTLFWTPQDRGGAEAHVSELANRIRSYRVGTEKAVDQAMAQATRQGVPVRFHMVKETADLVFTGQDIAADCFHLSVAGQGKVAETVLKAVKSGG